MTIRQDKLASLIQKLAGEFLIHEKERKSLITPIRVDVSKDFKNSTIYVSVFPENEEVGSMSFLRTKRSDFRDFVKSQIEIKSIPFFDFKIDMGEKNRQRIQELSE